MPTVRQSVRRSETRGDSGCGARQGARNSPPPAISLVLPIPFFDPHDHQNDGVAIVLAALSSITATASLDRGARLHDRIALRSTRI